MPDACSAAAGVQEQAGLGAVAQGGHRGVGVAEARVRRRDGPVAHEVGQVRREPLWRAGRRVVVCERAAVAGAPSKGATRVLRTLGRT